MTDLELPAAVLWDMDGTLVDTEPYWIEAETELAARFGATWTDEQGLLLVGRNLIDSAEIFRNATGVPLSPPEIVAELLVGVNERMERGIPWRPGALELLALLADDGIPMALVTMSYRSFADTMLQHLPTDTFAAIVTGDIVDRGKPHPEPYLAAARLLGVPIDRCVAVEDSETGATSAAAAGCAVLVVPSHVPVTEGPRRVFLDSLDGCVPSDLAAVLEKAGS